ncbi:hypothetical protein KBY66_04035 [Synechococcus sp. Tobar12-5m-g]|uniref:GIVxVP protein n=1 Tax=unclassified Synechococcus TaxID=2626047 RepID=UPI0020CD7721|nr:MULTISPECIES: GIVxVP protein [unclassified Synechococcus]MCP9771797.1 hypothetical protein [Synechococcus sp. Tobar12-5m-g]MCP9872739.1 hypothetical protein [Synechococcus sp. Cruz CV-v-12]
MGLNRTAKGIVLVPSLLLGGAFLSASVWSQAEGGGNRTLAAALGAILLATGLLSQLLPEPAGPVPDKEPAVDGEPPNLPPPKAMDHGERRG